MDELPTDFVVYLYDPTDPTGELRLLLLRENDAFSEIGIEDLRKLSTGIVTYQLSALVDGGAGPWLNNNSQVIDIDMALTLAAEQPRREAQGSKSFSFLECLRSSSDPGIKPFAVYCFQGDRTQSDAVIFAATKKVARNLRDVANNVFGRLRETNGLARLTEVEVPVSRILHRRQALGLRVDGEAIRAKVSALGEVAARARSNLRKEFAILDPSDRGQVASAIQNDPHLCEIVDAEESEWSVESVLKLYAHVSSLAANLRNYRDAQKSRVILQRFGIFKNGRVHPDYRVAGTVTGRILVRNPSLQNISRSYRDVLLADEGKTMSSFTNCCTSPCRTMAASGRCSCERIWASGKSWRSNYIGTTSFNWRKHSQHLNPAEWRLDKRRRNVVALTGAKLRSAALPRQCMSLWE